jgi:hypothetical protein
MDPDYAASRQRHMREVDTAVKRLRTKGVSLNRAAVFEQFAPTPVSQQR